MDEGDVFISPQPAGSKSAFAKILVAVVIIAAMAVGGAFAAGGWAVGAGATGSGMFAGLAAGLSGWGMLAVGVALNLALTGIQQLMAPDPSMDIPENTPESSYLFRGAEQTVLEGDPVPVVYGELRVPGRPIGFELRNKENVYSNYYSNGGYGWYPGSGSYYSAVSMR